MTEVPPRTRQVRLDSDRFDCVQRLAMYEIAGAMLDLSCEAQQVLGLRPDACQIYLLIAVSTVQRHVRAHDGSFVGAAPLPEEMFSTVSRRRLSDVSGLPRETVARHVRHLIERGLVVEIARGRLSIPSGLLREVGPSGALERMAQRVATLANALIRLDVLVPAPPRR